MHIKEKMQLMYSNPVNAWHEHVWFRGGAADPVLNVARLDHEMEAYDLMGFDKLVMSLPVTNPKRCSAELFKAANVAVYESMKRYPGKIYGMAYVHAGHIKEALYEIDHCVQDLGMVGLKLYYDYFMDDPVQDPIIEKCIELDVPIMMHSMRCMDPPNHIRQPLCSTGVHMANAAKRYPEAVFQMGHFTITDWEFQLKAIAPYKNIYTDMSGSAYDCPQIERAVEMLGADRILFATDNSIVSCVGKILGADISEADKKTILDGTAFNRFLEKAGR
jgi:predicted TIM-barrel fold metal-dependent hydrolase